MKTVNYFIPSINFTVCKHRIETWLSTMEGILSVAVNVKARQVVIVFDSPATEELIQAFLARVNYPVK